jgi:hypothetical protein
MEKTMTNEQIIQQINNDIKRFPWMDFGIACFSDGDGLFVRGSIDESYGCQVEIKFSHVLYIDCATVWKTNTEEDAVFFVKDEKLLSNDERYKFFENGSGAVVGFCAEGLPGKNYFYIVCREILYAAVKDTNKYFKREYDKEQMNIFELEFTDEIKFDAAGVPQSKREEYHDAFAEFVKGRRGGGKK